MNICDNDHEEIVFMTGYCPLCEALEEKEDLEDKIDDLASRLEQCEHDAQNKHTD